VEPFLDPNDRFRERRAQSRRRRRLRRTVGAIALLLAAAAVAVGAGFLPDRGEKTSAEPAAVKKKAAAPKRTGPPVPEEIRGVHVTMALASLDGKLAEYTRIPGINTIQLDVKDENGEVAFHRLAPPLAKRVGSAMRYYDPVKAAKQVHSEGLFLIGRVVCFEDPILSRGRPDLAIRTRSASGTTTFGSRRPPPGPASTRSSSTTSGSRATATSSPRSFRASRTRPWA